MVFFCKKLQFKQFKIKGYRGELDVSKYIENKIYSDISWTAIYGDLLIVLLRVFIDFLIY